MKCSTCARRDGYHAGATAYWLGTCTCAGFQVCSTSWSDASGRIPEGPLFGGKVFATRQEAVSAWYDSAPGQNDHMVIIRIG